jgi:hypothetical protein
MSQVEKDAMAIVNAIENLIDAKIDNSRYRMADRNITSARESLIRENLIIKLVEALS